ncbi:MAG: hypothetical protein R3A44_10295 [Caldilineaceae bacterium]
MVSKKIMRVGSDTVEITIRGGQSNPSDIVKMALPRFDNLQPSEMLDLAISIAKEMDIPLPPDAEWIAESLDIDLDDPKSSEEFRDTPYTLVSGKKMVKRRSVGDDAHECPWGDGQTRNSFCEVQGPTRGHLGKWPG